MTITRSLPAGAASSRGAGTRSDASRASGIGGSAVGKWPSCQALVSLTLPNDSPHQPREVVAGKDARALARDLLGMEKAELSAAFEGSPLRRAKLRG